jgi:hypothetical protein
MLLSKVREYRRQPELDACFIAREGPQRCDKRSDVAEPNTQYFSTSFEETKEFKLQCPARAKEYVHPIEGGASNDIDESSKLKVEDNSVRIVIDPCCLLKSLEVRLGHCANRCCDSVHKVVKRLPCQLEKLALVTTIDEYEPTSPQSATAMNYICTFQTRLCRPTAFDVPSFLESVQVRHKIPEMQKQQLRPKQLQEDPVS